MKVLYFNRKILYWVIVGVVAVVLLILLLTGSGDAPPDTYPTMGEGICGILGSI